MHNLLVYPRNNQLIVRKKKSIKRELLAQNNFIEKNIAILGGSTTNDVKDILELFLLNNGIKLNFYQSKFGQYWEDVMFENIILFKGDCDQDRPN